MDIREEKAAVRREILALRERLSDEERLRKSGEIFSKVLALPEYGRAHTVLAYCGFGSEPETGVFLEAALRDGKRLVLPRVERETNSLVLHIVRDLASELVPGTWGIMEPSESLPRTEIEDVDFVLVPGVAFDREGGRLGYGGGFYDGMLGDLTQRPPLVAVAFDLQIVERVPTDSHDVKVDIILTERHEIFPAT